MRILFLDDDKERIKIFLENFSRENIIIDVVETARECIDKLKENTYDVISLDHDLGNETFVISSRTDCGMEVVRFLMNNIEYCDPIEFVIYHSFNHPAVKQMYDNLFEIFPYAVIAPFMGSEFKEIFNYIINESK